MYVCIWIYEVNFDHLYEIKKDLKSLKNEIFKKKSKNFINKRMIHTILVFHIIMRMRQ